MELRLRLFPIPNPSYLPLVSHTYQLPVSIGGTVQLQTSTNITDWLPVITVTNNGIVVEWLHYGTSRTNRFFRVVPGNGQN